MFEPSLEEMVSEGNEGAGLADELKIENRDMTGMINVFSMYLVTSYPNLTNIYRR